MTCGGGNQTQTRTCTNPDPSNGGINCSTTNVDTAVQTCNTLPCPIGKIIQTLLFHEHIFSNIFCNTFAFFQMAIGLYGHNGALAA